MSDEVEQAARWISARSVMATDQAIAGAFRNVSDLIRRLRDERDEARIAWEETHIAIAEARNKALHDAAMIAQKHQQRQARKREPEHEESEDWQVYNQGVFVASAIKNQILSLKTPHTLPHTSQSETASV